MRRILSLWLPQWPVERWRRTSAINVKEGRPFALTHSLDNTQKLYAVCPRAYDIGLRGGMTLAEARAMLPDVYTAEADREADHKALTQLALWLGRYSPLTAVDGHDGLLIDSTGCAHLFGGEAAMLADIRARLARAGFTVCLAIAETRGAAWACARYGEDGFLQQGSLSDCLSPLPMQALRLDKEAVLTLERLGLKTIGQLTAIPRASLARRFRDLPAKEVTALLTRLDQALGRKDEPLMPLREPPRWQVRQAFMEPVLHLDLLERALEALASDLSIILQEAEQGARRLVLTAFRVDGTLQQSVVGTSRPTHTPEHFCRLFAEKITGFEAGFGFDLITLAASETQALRPQQVGNRQEEDIAAAARFLDRVAARLGPEAVCQISHHESHQPEKCQQLVPAGTTGLAWEQFPHGKAPRPLRLLPRPEGIEVLAEVPEGPPMRFRWRRLSHRVLKAAGPERIAAEWWLTGHQDTRDYYQVEVEDGARFWLFRKGLYAVPGVRPAEENSPQWFLHGFFA